MVSSASAVNRQIGRRVAEFRGWVARKLRVMHPGCPGCSPQSGSLSCARNRGRAGWPGAMALAGVTQTTPGNRGRLVSCLQQLSQIGQRDLETDSAGSNGWQYRKCMRYNGLQRGSRKTEGPRCGGHSLNGRTAPATLDERSGSCRATSRRMGVSVPPRGTVARNAIKRGVTHESGATSRRFRSEYRSAWLIGSDNPDNRPWPTRKWPARGEPIGEVRWVWYSLP